MYALLANLNSEVKSSVNKYNDLSNYQTIKLSILN